MSLQKRHFAPLLMVLISLQATISCSLKPDLDAAYSLLSPYPAPQLTAVSPAKVNTTGETLLTLTGENFRPGMTVVVGGEPCPVVGLSGTSEIQCRVPQHPEGSFEVQVIGYDDKLSDKVLVQYDDWAFTEMETLIGDPKNDINTYPREGYRTFAQSLGASGMLLKDGYLFTAEGDGRQIRRIDYKNYYTYYLAGSGFNGSDDISKDDPKQCVLKDIWTITSDTQNLYFPTSTKGIVKAPIQDGLSSGPLELIAGISPENYDDPNDESDPLAVRFSTIKFLAHHANQLFVFDRLISNNNTIVRKFDLTSNMISVVVGDFNYDNSVNPISSDGVGSSAAIYNVALAIQVDSNIYFVEDDYRNYRLRKLDLNSLEVTTLHNLNETSERGADGGPGAAELTNIVGLAFMPSRNELILMDEVSAVEVVRIRTMNLSTKEVTTKFEIGLNYESPKDGPLEKAQLRAYRVRGIFLIPNFGILVGSEKSLQRIF